jgi:hypothetical protein
VVGLIIAVVSGVVGSGKFGTRSGDVRGGWLVVVTWGPIVGAIVRAIVGVVGVRIGRG